MLAEPIRAPVGLATQPADKVQDVLRIVVPNDVLDWLMFGHTAAPAIVPSGISSGRRGNRPAAAGAQVVGAVGSPAPRRLRAGHRHRQGLAAATGQRVRGNPRSHRDGGNPHPALKTCRGSGGGGAEGGGEVGGGNGVQLGPTSPGGQERLCGVSWVGVGGRWVALMTSGGTVCRWVGGVMRR